MSFALVRRETYSQIPGRRIMPFNDETGSLPAKSAPDSPGILLRFYFYSFVLVAFAHEAYHLSTGESFFWKIGDGTVRLTSMASDHATTLGPIVLLGAVLISAACCNLLDAAGSRSRRTVRTSPCEASSGHNELPQAIPQLLRQ